MAIGQSGRIVIEIDPALKRGLYAVLTAEGLTLKEWFTDVAKQQISGIEQPDLPFRTPRQ